MKKIISPMDKDTIKNLNKGDIVLISGIIYTARDAAHKKMQQHLNATGEMLLSGQTIYYAGPCPARPGEVIGSVGPTTSYRMDSFTPVFAKKGILTTIGKGKRNAAAAEAIRQNGGVHFDAIGGAGAYYKNCVKQCEIVYFPELGAEAIYKLTVEDFPAVVSII
jgi:fumarate hydratase subunit beta